METSTDIGTNAPTRQTLGWFGPVFAAVVVVANLLAVWVAWEDSSWFALGIAFMLGPMLNGALALAGLVAISFLRRRRSPFPLATHLALTLGLPTVAIIADLFAILSMELRGH